METTTKLHSQIACEAGVSKDAAQSAAYLLDLSREGKTLDQAAELMRRGRSDVRSIARDWGIPFPDYTPAPPLMLGWSKTAGGGLELHLGGQLVAQAHRLESAARTDTAFEARWLATPNGPVERAATALAAAKKLSVEIDRHAVALLGADDIAITLPDGAGGGLPFLPRPIGPAKRLRSSLLGAG